MNRFRIYVLLTIALLFCGCIVTGNILVIVELEDGNLKSEQSSEQWLVSKDSVQAWTDHFADINHVVDVGFALIIANNNPTNEATGEFYISRDKSLDTADDVKAKAIKVLGGITVKPGARRSIKWRESYDFLRNFDSLKALVLDGEFMVYAIGIGQGLDIEIKNPAVILTVNAKP